MANEKKIWQFAQEAGFRPRENRCIVVKYAPDNLSEKIADFFNCEFYVMQLCEHELILLPFDRLWGNLSKDVSLTLSYDGIRSVEINDDLLNTIITIQTGTDTIRLTTQQKELSDWRMSGINATQFSGGIKNWHKENLDGTLKDLKEIATA